MFSCTEIGLFSPILQKEKGGGWRVEDKNQHGFKFKSSCTLKTLNFLNYKSNKIDDKFLNDVWENKTFLNIYLKVGMFCNSFRGIVTEILSI